MKKNSFIEGALISTIGIVLCKILGLLYVIPFRAIVGVEGSVLYGYAYTIYSVFAGLSSNGIPSAMSKTVSEYNTLGYYNSQERAYKIGKYIINGIGIVSFLILFIFAPQMAHLIIGDIEGGSNLNDIVMVIRIISTSLIFIPLLSISKGYVQGHRMMRVPAIANVIEQLVRVIVIIAGSFLTLKVFNLSITTAVGVSVFGATIGALIAYLYVLDKIRKNREALKRNEKMTRAEAKITNKEIFKKIVLYALPFILIEFIRSIYNTVDTFTVVKTLVSVGYNIKDAENILSIITTWGSKLNMIVLSITMGLTISLIPNVVSSATLKKYDEVSQKINQALKIILFVALPMTLGLWFLSNSVWTIFYGYDQLSTSVFKVYILQAIVMSFYYILVDANQALSNTKVALGTLIVTFILKLIFNTPVMLLFNYLKLPAYIGAIITTILAQALAIIFLLLNLKKKYKVNYKDTFITGVKIIILNLIMIVSLSIVRLVIGEFPHTRLYSLLEIIIYGLIGIFVYGFIAYKEHLFEDVFGKELLNKFKRN